jgi:antitoxin VapB
VSLNIKNERVCRLAKEAAALTGQSQVSVLEQALEAFIEERSRPAREGVAGPDDLHRLIERMRGAIRQAGVIRTVEDLYDEATGLPR